MAIRDNFLGWGSQATPRNRGAVFVFLTCVCSAQAFAESLPPKSLPPPPILQDPVLSKYLYDQYQEIERLRQRLAETERRLELVEKILADQMQKEIESLTIGPRR